MMRSGASFRQLTASSPGIGTTNDSASLELIVLAPGFSLTWRTAMPIKAR
jgi:hypothetical protein